MSSWTELFTHAESGDHVVQLYGEDDQSLTKNVSRYLAEGMRRLDGLTTALSSIVAAHTHLFAGPRTMLSSGRVRD